MISKVLALRSRTELSENRAKRWQIYGRLLSVHADINRKDALARRSLNALRRLIILIFVLAMPCAIFAKTDQASWENLSALTAGRKIQVLELNSTKVSGRFVGFSNANISLQEQNGAQTIRRQDVRSVTLMENHHRLRNTLIGAAVGAGTGAAIGAASYSPCAPAQTFCIDPIGRGGAAGIVAIVGGVGGAVVGALWPSHKTIFRAAGR